MCVILSAALLGPRIVNVIWWLLASDRWSSAFGGNFLLPLLGVIALPWTTLAFVLVAPQGLDSISGFGFIVVLIGLVADVTTYGGGAYSNRDKFGFQYD